MERKPKAEAKKNKALKEGQKENIAGASNKNRFTTRGRIFDGIVTKKFSKRVVIEFERMIYVRKYERYARLKTKLHARLPDSMEKEINLGDLVRVHECRPLSKIIHFVVIEKVKDASETKK